jgi:hypothetical protein
MWSLAGGTWKVSKIAAGGYAVVEYGAIGQLGTGTATFDIPVLTIDLVNRFLGKIRYVMTVQGNEMSGWTTALKMKVPISAKRVSK